ncbi:hypothetical protein [Ferrimonas sp. SCSIO 43195]|uniref:hypothetical protein n=1 Tax=Ferrimonas sp. SCSIO 43195 TaxID=2822844 RepID=UPI00207615EB|nr:hypothetical protein [Ferrimonas sp. SCSIO 43195]USD39620.1 hypothetical protein J8Z22_11285 [Ferrimonas sp. SCSIO 43195]
MMFRTVGALVSGLLILTGCSDNNEQVTDPSLCQFETGPCQFAISGETLSLTMTPANAPSEQPLALSLAAPEGWSLNSALVEGRDMFMGRIPVNFDADGQGELMYGSCASGYMVWQLQLQFTDADGTEQRVDFNWLADH